MKMYTRTASVTWLGTHQNGKGAISTPSSKLNNVPYTFGANGKRSGTNSPELIAAAHAGSFAISLADELRIAGFRPDRIDTKATVTMEGVKDAWKVTQIELDVLASVPRVVQGDFLDAALRAKANCPISQLVSANVSMCARLTPGEAAARLLPHREPAPLRASRKKKLTRTGTKH